jgi:hypothetical protein
VNLKQATHRSALAAIVLCVAHPSGPGNAEASDVPVYPGATKVPTHVKASAVSCGHKIEVVPYETAAGAKAVAKWYQREIPGASVLDQSTTDSGDVDTQITVLKPDGSEGVNVHQTVLGNAGLQAAAKQLGSDKTEIGITTYTPPLGAGYVALESRAVHHDAGALAQLKAACPNG